MTPSSEDYEDQLVRESRLHVALKSSEGHCRKRKTRRVFVNRGGQLYETPTPSLERQQLKLGSIGFPKTHGETSDGKFRIRILSEKEK